MRAVRQLGAIVNRRAAAHIAETFLGYQNNSSSKVAPQELKTVVIEGQSFSVKCDVRKQRARGLERALVSYRSAVAEGLAKFISRSITRTLIAVSVFDDASMWVRTPNDTRLRHLIQTRKLMQRGRNVHLPVFSDVQRVFVRGDSQLECCQIHSPSVVLPEANWRTVWDRWQRRTLITGEGVGSQLAGLGPSRDALVAAVDSCDWQILIACKDALQLNQCIIAEEERAMARVRSLTSIQPAPKLITIFDLNCTSHAACLAGKPAYLAFEGLPDALVRLAHLLESGRAVRTFEGVLDRLVEKNFRWREVFELPQQAAQWRSNANKIFQPSLVAMDLTQTDVDDILRHDNGDPASNLFWHYCRVGVCKICKGSRAKGLAEMQRVVKLAFTGGMVVPLLYRWKYLERAVGYCGRGVRYHSLLPRAISTMWSKKRRREAAEANAGAARRIANGNDADVDQQLSLADRQAIRASKTLQFFAAIKGTAIFDEVYAVTHPVQVYLNQAFAAEKQVTTYTRLMELGTEGTPECELKRAASEAFRLNRLILSGARGAQACGRLLDMLLSDSAAGWAELPTDVRENADTFFNLRLRITRVLGDMWRRTEFYYSDSRFTIFDACFAASPEYDADTVNRVVQSLTEKAEQCAQCLDDATAVVLRMLKKAPARAVRCIFDLGCVAAVQSAPVEKQHLLGQETRSTRKRGRALSAQQLAAHSFRSSIIQHGKRKADGVQRLVLVDKHGLTMPAVSGWLRKYRLGPAMSAQKRRGEVSTKPKRFRSTSKFAVFRRQNWSVQARVGSPEYAAEQQRISRLWATYSPDEKNLYEADAENTSLLRKQATAPGLLGPSTWQEISTSDASKALSRYQLSSVKDAALKRAWNDVTHHPAWQKGFGLGDVSAALKPSEIEMSPSCAAWASVAGRDRETRHCESSSLA